MEKILVPIWPNQDDIWVTVHGMQLARRINAQLFLLEFLDSKQTTHTLPDNNGGDRAVIIKSLVMDAKKGGVRSVYYNVNGEFHTEVIKYIKEHNISIVVLELPERKVGKHANDILMLVKKLMETNECKIEFVKHHC
ncbi:universal stress protein [Desulfohalobiaceae bacterium Ax17]|uniref:hypothetical protein n=1 Tax=Desulfovulcanus ferrireducens TaxID=2831190 RepID=UPI00207BA012|nr:hypothetical protein [Desulfovulcanus ferrireducens]MBT8763425.1 universal stress protein [Desulfovulcanus ferrireducens]